MRKRVASSFFLSLLPVLLGPACSTEHSSFYPPIEEEVVIVPGGTYDSDFSPSISRDARVLVWVRMIYPSPVRYAVVRWDRNAEPETLLSALSREILSADVSPDGERVVAHISPDSLWVWDRGDSVTSRWLKAPPGFSLLTSPRWMDDDHVLIGALGPEGRGIWIWDLRENALAPLCTRFPEEVFDWAGASPGIDRSGELFCMRRRAGRSCVGSLATCEVVTPIEGYSPAFWTITPDEEDAVLYINPANDLVGERRAIREKFVLMESVFDFDVSIDGRWVLAWASRPQGRLLVLRDLRDLR